MMFILLSAFLGTTLAKDMLPQVSYLVIQENSSWTGAASHGILRDVMVEGKWPSFINYTEDLDSDSGIQVQVTFEDNKGESHEEYESVPESDICDVLKKAIANETSAEAKFLIPQALGLYGTKCPIEAGLKSIAPYQFPTLVRMAEMGVGPRKMSMTVKERKIHSSKIIFQLSVDMNVRYWPMKVTPNEFYQLTITESIRSSSNISVSEMSAIIVSLMLALWL